MLPWCSICYHDMYLVQLVMQLVLAIDYFRKICTSQLRLCGKSYVAHSEFDLTRFNNHRKLSLISLMKAIKS